MEATEVINEEIVYVLNYSLYSTGKVPDLVQVIQEVVQTTIAPSTVQTHAPSTKSTASQLAQDDAFKDSLATFPSSVFINAEWELPLLVILGLGVATVALVSGMTIYLCCCILLDDNDEDDGGGGEQSQSSKQPHRGHRRRFRHNRFTKTVSNVYSRLGVGSTLAEVSKRVKRTATTTKHHKQRSPASQWKQSLGNKNKAGGSAPSTTRTPTTSTTTSSSVHPTLTVKNTRTLPLL